MKIKDLIQELAKYNPEYEVVFYRNSFTQIPVTACGILDQLDWHPKYMSYAASISSEPKLPNFICYIR